MSQSKIYYVCGWIHVDFQIEGVEIEELEIHFKVDSGYKACTLCKIPPGITLKC